MNTDPTAELHDLYERWFASIPAKDASFVDRHMHPTLQMIGPDGVRLDTAGYKAMYAMLPAGSTVEHRFSEFVVRRLGDAAVMVTGVYHGRVEYEGTVLNEKLVRFISVWEHDQDRWFLLVHQLTAVGPG
jgi:ketosteroid isomerase-like protein